MQNAHPRGQQGVADPWIGGASQGLPHHRRIIDCVVSDSHHRPAVLHHSGRTARRLPVKGPLSLPVTTWD